MCGLSPHLGGQGEDLLHFCVLCESISQSYTNSLIHSNRFNLNFLNFNLMLERKMQKKVYIPGRRAVFLREKAKEVVNNFVINLLMSLGLFINLYIH